MLNRRVAGLLLLVVAVVGSLLIARLGGTRVAGTAIARPDLGAPAVGECLVTIIGPPAMPLVAPVPPSPVSIASVGETSVRFADCAAAHVGEVVAYRAVPAADSAEAADVGSGPTVAPTPPSSAVDSSALVATAAASAVSDGEWCQGVAADYREHSVARFRDGVDAAWVPSTGQRFAVILSAPTPDPGAPRWAACAFLSPGLEPYLGSYVRSLANLPAPAPFGMCRSSEDSWVSCAAPHRVQEFGTAARIDSSSPEALAGCRSLIEQMTRMKDVTAGGGLRVEIAGGKGGAGPGATRSAAVASCRLVVVADEYLVGTLVGIGDRPLPLN